MARGEADQENETKAAVRSLAIKAGVGVAAASAGGIHPFIGAMVALAPDVCLAMRKVVADFVQRQESPRRANRALVATEYIVGGITARLEKGERIRDDDFFDVVSDRSKAEEVYEAVVDACIRQFEEKKIPHIAKVYEHAVFNKTPTSTLNSILQQANEKTWRHYCLLSLLADAGSGALVSQFYHLHDDQLDPSTDAPHLRADLERLQGRATGLTNEVAGSLRLTQNGRLFVQLTDLGSIQDAEVRVILDTIDAAVARRHAQ